MKVFRLKARFASAASLAIRAEAAEGGDVAAARRDDLAPAGAVHGGGDGLLRDKTRPPGKPPTPEAKVRELMETALAPPPDGETHWTLRALAEKVGIAAAAHDVLARHRIAPHRWRHFKVSKDPEFEEKTRDITGPA